MYRTTTLPIAKAPVVVQSNIAWGESDGNPTDTVHFYLAGPCGLKPIPVKQARLASN